MSMLDELFFFLELGRELDEKNEDMKKLARVAATKLKRMKLPNDFPRRWIFVFFPRTGR